MYDFKYMTKFYKKNSGKFFGIKTALLICGNRESCSDYPSRMKEKTFTEMTHVYV